MRKILTITGTRADYGLMRPIYRAINASDSLEFEIIVTGMHLLPEFHTSLCEIEDDDFCPRHRVHTILSENSGRAMAQSLGQSIIGFSPVFDKVKPDIVLLQGDRGEMLAGAIVAAHMNIPIVHMSGGDYSGTIDDSIRNSISKLAHFHLTTCALSTQRLLAMGEPSNRIVEVGEPGLDAIRTMTFSPPETLAAELNLDLSKPFILATQHPVTTEVDQAAWQMTQTLQALAEMDMQVVFTYPNMDAGGREMVEVLESYRKERFLRIFPNLGSQKFLSLMKIASVMVGNSSSGILEAASFKLPVVNIGTRQHGRLRTTNVVDVEYDRTEIKNAICHVLENKEYRESLRECRNPYGDGQAAEKSVKIFNHLKLSPSLITKWIKNENPFLSEV